MLRETEQRKLDLEIDKETARLISQGVPSWIALMQAVEKVQRKRTYTKGAKQ